MPNRIVREGILDSERVNALGWAAEVFYRRLMSVVDDFGRFDGRIKILRSRLYALKDNVSDSDVDKWLASVQASGLVRVYRVFEKPYVELLDFNQRTRAKESKYPPPDRQTLDVCQTHDRHLRTETETETETETCTETARERVSTHTGGIPPVSLEKALKHAEMYAVCLPECVEKWWFTNDAKNWQGVLNWKSSLKGYSISWKQWESQGRSFGNAQAPVSEKEKEIEEVRQKIGSMSCLADYQEEGRLVFGEKTHQERYDALVEKLGALGGKL